MALINYLNKWFPRYFRTIDGDRLNRVVGADILTTDSMVLGIGTTAATAAPFGNAYTVVDPASAANSGIIISGANVVTGSNLLTQPRQPVGTRLTVTNLAAGAVLVYPELNSGNTINSGAASYSMATGTTHMFIKSINSTTGAVDWKLCF